MELRVLQFLFPLRCRRAAAGYRAAIVISVIVVGAVTALATEYRAPRFVVTASGRQFSALHIFSPSTVAGIAGNAEKAGPREFLHFLHFLHPHRAMD